MNCPKCNTPSALHEQQCSVCGRFLAFPNVAYATQPSEVAALDQRYDTALTSARARSVLAETLAFETAVSTSKAVFNRSLSALHTWITGGSPLFLTFHQQVENQGRVPTSTNWDQQREAAESSISPFFFKDISYAALSLDDFGMNYYGEYTIILKNITIEDRATVFEQNCFYFNRAHGVIAGTAPPVGFRASWEQRGRLAVAKLQPKIMSGSNDHANILIEPRREEPDCDFIEVHILGPVNRACIEAIVGPVPTEPADKPIWRHLKRKAEELGISVKERA